MNETQHSPSILLYTPNVLRVKNPMLASKRDAKQSYPHHQRFFRHWRAFGIRVWEEIGDRVRDLGSPGVIVIRADVLKIDDCRRLVDETVNHFGRLDHLVNNAGINSACLFEDAPPNMANFRTIMVNDFYVGFKFLQPAVVFSVASLFIAIFVIADVIAVIDTNFWGSVYTTKFAVPHLKNSRGKIVVISSAASWMNDPRFSVYSASKAALNAFFDTSRIEIRSYVTITIATPGSTRSDPSRITRWLRRGDSEEREPGRPVRDAAFVVQDDLPVEELYPELVEWGYRFFTLGAPQQEAPNKKILDLTGLKNVVYPASIRSPEIKTG
ncbi:hypothetical protein F3Y22_tig00110429pilonHSYRG00214 [Hibiscus syriacus]|uniref:Uncharacterized protein n=1 Tax=Hibiscus syriacus TaxID=106335 RepID=A0A6A3AKW1_HIBSY|nr:hypothetical protein F3Y22_tig00110429pilonHSYRG00214 [Hibiscus syriacus]